MAPSDDALVDTLRSRSLSVGRPLVTVKRISAPVSIWMAQRPGRKVGTMNAFSTLVRSVSDPEPRLDEPNWGSSPQPEVADATAAMITSEVLKW